MNLRLTRRGDYVVRSAVCLARAYGPDSGATTAGVHVKLREVSEAMRVPRTFVGQILGDLVHAGIAVSAYGVHGGYRLARSPEEVSVFDVLEAAEGPLVGDECVLGEGPCHWDAVCPMHATWSAAAGALRDVLAKTTLADLARTDQAIEQGSYPVPSDAHRARSAKARSIEVGTAVRVARGLPAAAVMLRTPGSYLVAPASRGSVPPDAGAIGTRVGPGGLSWLGKSVTMHVGDIQDEAGSLVVPVAWEATGASRLFPRFDGALRLRACGPDAAELTLSGRYTPPLGAAGHMLDDAILARVARSTVRALVQRVARALEGDSAAAVPAAPLRPTGALWATGR